VNEDDGRILIERLKYDMFFFELIALLSYLLFRIFPFNSEEESDRWALPVVVEPDDDGRKSRISELIPAAVLLRLRTGVEEIPY
jgi:hypothetical protein